MNLSLLDSLNFFIPKHGLWPLNRFVRIPKLYVALIISTTLLAIAFRPSLPSIFLGTFFDAPRAVRVNIHRYFLKKRRIPPSYVSLKIPAANPVFRLTGPGISLSVSRSWARTSAPLISSQQEDITETHTDE